MVSPPGSIPASPVEKAPPEKKQGIAFPSAGSSSVPGNKKALFMELSGLPTDLGKIIPLYQKNNYDSTSVKPGGVDAFKNINSNSIIYISSHGTFFVWDDMPHFCIQTDDKRNPTQDELYVGDNGSSSYYRSKQVVLSRGVYIVENEDIDVSEDTHYAVTELFIDANNGAFPEDTVFYVDTCLSAKQRSVVEAPPLMGVLMMKGVYTYIGWTEPVSNMQAIRTLNFISTRMFGEIPDGLMAGISTKTPPIRPSGLHATITALVAKGWDTDPYPLEKEGGGTYPAATFVHGDFWQGTRDILFVPGISALNVVVDIIENKQTLSVQGNFGDQQGTVHVCQPDAMGLPSNCSQLTVSSWEQEEIVADLGLDCSNCNGVVVVTVEEHQSNPHPLTQWAMDFEINGVFNDEIGPDVKLTAKSKFRGEIVDERATSENDPLADNGQTTAPFGMDSECDYEFSGTFTDAVDCIYSYKKEENSGTQKVSGSGGDSEFTGTAKLQPIGQQATFNIALSKKVIGKKACPGEEIEDVEFQVNVQLIIDSAMGKYGKFESMTKNVSGYTVKFGPADPESPPNDNTQR